MGLSIRLVNHIAGFRRVR